MGQLARLFLCTGPVPAFATGVRRAPMNQVLPLFVLEVGREGIQVSPPLRVGHVAEEAAKHFGAVGRETQQRLSHLWVAGGGGGRRDRRYGSSVKIEGSVRTESAQETAHGTHEVIAGIPQGVRATGSR